MQETKSTCCYCGVGCGVVIQTDGGRITGVRGDADHPANFGRLCTKGATLHLTARLDTRALYPELRLSRDQQRSRVGWDEALDYSAERFAQIIRAHGPDSVAFYISGQLLTEDYYVFNKLAKGLIGTNNVDTNSRLCMSSAVAGYKATLGADAPPACYDDIGVTDCLFIAGSNTAFAHPILFRRIEDAKAANPALKIIVADPRRTDTAAAADLHLPLLPGSDIALYNAMLHVLLWEGLCDLDFIRAHTDGFDALKETLREYTPQAAASICGLPAQDIIQAAKWFGNAKAALSLYCQGLNQSVHGTHNNAALINLHLATGQIGKPGAGPFSLTGQPNAMGGREVGGMANLLSGHRDLANPAHRAEVAKLWGVAEVPAQPGKTAVELFDALASGAIKAVWIACTNPAQSMPDVERVRAALAKTELVVVQEAYRNTDTVAYADVLLPATTWGEKQGTVTNSERRISLVRPALAPPGETRHDWVIVQQFARRLGAKLDNPLTEKLFSYRGPADIFDEHRETTRGRDLDITGLSYPLLEERGPQQWPFPEGARDGRARLYEDGIFATPNGRARFVNTLHQATAEDTDARYPLHLTTGRLRDQWHGMSRTGTVAILFNHAPEPVLSMHRTDMARSNLKDGDLVRLSSRRGSVVVKAAASHEMRPGQVFMAMHWGSQFMTGAGVNALMAGAIDPISKQPELKHAAVRLEKIDLPWNLVVLRKSTAQRPASAQAAQLDSSLAPVASMALLQPLLLQFDYATLGLAGREEHLLVLRAANRAPVAEQVQQTLDDSLTGLHPEAEVMTYRDPKRGISKHALVENGQVTGVRLAGEVLAQDWLLSAMLQGVAADTVRPWVFAPLSQAPVEGVARRRVVCNCLDVSEQEILGQVRRGAGLEQIKSSLKCGTQCGSCVPELKRLCAGEQDKMAT